MGGSSSTQKDVKADKDAFKPVKGKGEVSSMQSRKQQQMDEVAQAKAARDSLMATEQAAKEKKEEDKLLKMKLE